LLLTLRPGEPTSLIRPLLSLRAASTVVRPSLLSESAVGVIVRDTLGDRGTEELCNAVWTATGGNPFYLTELLRAIELDYGRPVQRLAGGSAEIARLVIDRVRGIDPRALDLAQALAVLGDGCELRHAAAAAGVEMTQASRCAY
jgi:hypothetical protein